MGTVICPKCQKDDMVQKVTSIVSGGTSTVNYRASNAYGAANGTAVSQTSLSSRLSPPRKPQPGIILGLSFTLSLVGLVPIIGNLCSLARGYSSLNSTFLVILLVDIALIVLAVIGFSKYRRATKVWENSVVPQWAELYYCSRDDCVFDPRTNRVASPEGLKSLLSQ